MLDLWCINVLNCLVVMTTNICIVLHVTQKKLYQLETPVTLLLFIKI